MKVRQSSWQGRSVCLHQAVPSILQHMTTELLGVIHMKAVCHQATCSMNKPQSMTIELLGMTHQKAVCHQAACIASTHSMTNSRHEGVHSKQGCPVPTSSWFAH